MSKRKQQERPKDSLVRVQYADLVCNVAATRESVGDVRLTVRDYNQRELGFSGYTYDPPRQMSLRLSPSQALDLAGALKLAVEQAR